MTDQEDPRTTSYAVCWAFILGTGGLGALDLYWTWTRIADPATPGWCLLLGTVLSIALGCFVGVKMFRTRRRSDSVPPQTPTRRVGRSIAVSGGGLGVFLAATASPLTPILFWLLGSSLFVFGTAGWLRFLQLYRAAS